MHIDHERREVVFSLTYFGPGLVGKTSALRYVHIKTRPELGTPFARTILASRLPLVSFEMTPTAIKIAAYQVRLRLCANPTGLWTQDSRRVSLEFADGVMFVADSTPLRWDANHEALASLEHLLASGAAARPDPPRVFMYNKRDHPDCVSVAALEQALNPEHRPAFETVAIHGVNVFDALKALMRLVITPHRATLERSLQSH